MPAAAARGGDVDVGDGAWACGERTKHAYACPGRLTSSL